MVFVGFGLMRAYLKNHQWSSIGFNLMIGAYALQLSILSVSFWNFILVKKELVKITLDLKALIVGDFGAAAVLITMGVLLGKASIHQLWLFATLEVAIFGLNEALVNGVMKVVDVGGAIYIHVFGAYFGVAACYFFQRYEARHSSKGRDEGDYYSSVIGMIGTLFLFVYWPSFNIALAGGLQERAVINTVFALTGGCIGALGITRMLFQRLDMEVLLNATISGGVAISSVTCLLVTPGFALAIGTGAGVISGLCLLRMKAWLENGLKLHDTSGIQFSHGFSGILGGVVSGVATTFAP